ncbi:MAG TPA: hypothetical protein PKG52_10670 [bacterium]|nr:hypothetical protein [bacterium]HPS31345.1 hypothetical protein [bacterium]
MCRFVIGAILFLFILQIYGQENADVSQSVIPAKETHHSVYFKPKLSVSFTDSRHVPGVTDGIYFNTDLDVVLNYKYKMEMHEFLVDFLLKEGISYTPVFDGFIISSDLTKLDLQYNLMFHKKWGWYLKAGLETHLFNGYDYQTEKTEYIVDSVRKPAAKKYQTTSSGLPLFLYEGTGLLHRPIDEENTKLEFNLGLVARQVWVGDSLKLDDDAATPEREMTSLTDIYEVGGEFGATYKGTIEDKKLGYDIMAKFIMPFYSKERENLGLSWKDVLQFDGHVKIDFIINKYVSFNYTFTVKRDFAIIKEWQLTNGLYLTLFYELDKKY